MQKELEEMGLTSVEAKIYLTLVIKGPSLAGVIAKETGIHRRTAYDILYRLRTKGLVSNIIIENKRNFEAVNPERLLEILKEKEVEKNRLGARPNKISLEERLLMWLEYMREYTTYFHTATKHKISESTCFRNCVWIEDILIKSKEFKLPNKKEFVNNACIETVVVDASESPIQRPKKSKENTTRERKRGTPSSLK